MARKSKSISKIITIVGLIGLLSSCSGVRKIERKYSNFDTTLFLTYVGDASFKDTLVSPLNKLSDLFDTYKVIPGLVNAYVVNNSDGFVEVDKDLYSILKFADEYYMQTLGVFNPLIKDVSELWKEAIKNKTFPNEEELNNALEITKSSFLEFEDENKVRINGEAHLDLGAIAKGYALAKMKDELNKNQITDYIFNAGFSSIILGENSELNGIYRVGINNTNNLYLELKNVSIGTSSIYEQGYLEKDGKIYSHIVNAETGSAEVKNHMAIAIGNDPILCDVYSTVAMLLPPEAIADFEKTVDAKFITLSNGVVTYSNPDLKVLSR